MQFAILALHVSTCCLTLLLGYAYGYPPAEEQRGTRHLFVTWLPVEVTVISWLVVSQFNEELRQRLWRAEIPGVDDGMIRSVQRVVTTAQYHRDHLVPSKFKFKLIYLQHFQVHHTACTYK